MTKRCPESTKGWSSIVSLCQIVSETRQKVSQILDLIYCRILARYLPWPDFYSDRVGRFESCCSEDDDLQKRPNCAYLRTFMHFCCFTSEFLFLILIQYQFNSKKVNQRCPSEKNSPHEKVYARLLRKRMAKWSNLPVMIEMQPSTPLTMQKTIAQEVSSGLWKVKVLWFLRQRRSMRAITLVSHRSISLIWTGPCLKKIASSERAPMELSIKSRLWRIQFSRQNMAVE